MQKLPLANEQNTDIRGGLPKKPVSLTERERQSSSDILEELRMQGIIKIPNATSKNRTADDSMLVDTGRPPQKPPAKLEKLEIKRKKAKAHNLTVENSENKTREEQLKKELLIDRPSPIIYHESRTKGSEINCSTAKVEKSSNTFQLLSFNLGAGSWMEKKELDDTVNSNFEGFSMVESDVTYNTVNEIF
ncbi:LOW QUALITY PROTEIN: stathmin domain-containing protein 1 [Rhineura floridana]|uniref:LOW QUALITY PROTEIN: stathmin domain-containing protein 1 n=1 Tax=Rhineura floridana TaxID=261503 RepID=UPI002AC7F90E|nr:LOW QUALITY PROTEIN: stathmin domain-containing protein 1 [Rhineura floridana]